MSSAPNSFVITYKNAGKTGDSGNPSHSTLLRSGTPSLASDMGGRQPSECIVVSTSLASGVGQKSLRGIELGQKPGSVVLPGLGGNGSGMSVVDGGDFAEAKLTNVSAPGVAEETKSEPGRFLSLAGVGAFMAAEKNWAIWCLCSKIYDPNAVEEQFHSASCFAMVQKNRPRGSCCFVEPGGKKCGAPAMDPLVQYLAHYLLMGTPLCCAHRGELGSTLEPAFVRWAQVRGDTMVCDETLVLKLGLLPGTVATGSTADRVDCAVLLVAAHRRVKPRAKPKLGAVHDFVVWVRPGLLSSEMMPTVRRLVSEYWQESRQSSKFGRTIVFPTGWDDGAVGELTSTSSSAAEPHGSSCGAGIGGDSDMASGGTSSADSGAGGEAPLATSSATGGAVAAGGGASPAVVSVAVQPAPVGGGASPPATVGETHTNPAVPTLTASVSANTRPWATSELTKGSVRRTPASLTPSAGVGAGSVSSELVTTNMGGAPSVAATTEAPPKEAAHSGGEAPGVPAPSAAPATVVRPTTSSAHIRTAPGAAAAPSGGAGGVSRARGAAPASEPVSEPATPRSEVSDTMDLAEGPATPTEQPVSRVNKKAKQPFDNDQFLKEEQRAARKQRASSASDSPSSSSSRPDSRSAAAAGELARMQLQLEAVREQLRFQSEAADRQMRELLAAQREAMREQQAMAHAAVVQLHGGVAAAATSNHTSAGVFTHAGAGGISDHARADATTGVGARARATSDYASAGASTDVGVFSHARANRDRANAPDGVDGLCASHSSSPDDVMRCGGAGGVCGPGRSAVDGHGGGAREHTEF